MRFGTTENRIEALKRLQNQNFKGFVIFEKGASKNNNNQKAKFELEFQNPQHMAFTTFIKYPGPLSPLARYIECSLAIPSARKYFSNKLE